jgi:hypothetical protein
LEIFTSSGHNKYHLEYSPRISVHTLGRRIVCGAIPEDVGTTVGLGLQFLKMLEQQLGQGSRIISQLLLRTMLAWLFGNWNSTLFYVYWLIKTYFSRGMFGMRLR